MSCVFGWLVGTSSSRHNAAFFVGLSDNVVVCRTTWVQSSTTRTSSLIELSPTSATPTTLRPASSPLQLTRPSYLPTKWPIYPCHRRGAVNDDVVTMFTAPADGVYQFNVIISAQGRQKVSLSVQCYAMHGKNINLPVRVCVCPSHFLSTRPQVRPLNGFLQLIA